MPLFRFCRCEYGCCRQDGLELDAMLLSFVEAYRKKLHTVLPDDFRSILETINKLLSSSLWVECLAAQGNKRSNLMGFVPTRWGSVCDCLDSFCQMRECVIEYQENKKCVIFSKQDFELGDMIWNLFARFRDVSH